MAVTVVGLREPERCAGREHRRPRGRVLAGDPAGAEPLGTRAPVRPDMKVGGPIPDRPPIKPEPRRQPEYRPDSPPTATGYPTGDGGDSTEEPATICPPQPRLAKSAFRGTRRATGTDRACARRPRIGRLAECASRSGNGGPGQRAENAHRRDRPRSDGRIGAARCTYRCARPGSGGCPPTLLVDRARAPRSTAAASSSVTSARQEAEVGRLGARAARRRCCRHGTPPRAGCSRASSAAGSRAWCAAPAAP